MPRLTGSLGCVVALVGTLSCLGALPCSLARGDALPRMKPERLQATRAAIEALAAARQEVALDHGLKDVRAAIHVHSLLSHDSRSPLAEVVAGAKAAGVQVVMFSEHPADHYDYVTDGHRGVHDGVLVIPGAETRGFLAFPQRSLKDHPAQSPQQFADLVRAADGLVFLSHLEERMDWEITGLTGTEIYNTHADVKDELGLLLALGQPLRMLAMLPLVEQFPQEWFACLLDYPADYLRRFDELCQTQRLTGVAANDAHHNQGIRAVLNESGKVEIVDRLGKKVTELDPAKNPAVKALADGRQSGETLAEFDPDPYERSLRHVSTHLLVDEVSEEAVREALSAGRAYVAFDWIADPTGFALKLHSGERTWPLGSEVPLEAGMRLAAAAPVPGFWRLIRDGREAATAMGRTLEFELSEPGVYRVEVWQSLADERRPWILSNPIYVRPEK